MRRGGACEAAGAGADLISLEVVVADVLKPAAAAVSELNLHMQHSLSRTRLLCLVARSDHSRLPLAVQ